MRKIYLITLIIFFSLIQIIYAQNFHKQEEELKISPPKESLIRGENLVYSVEWLGIPVGKIMLTIRNDIERIQDAECFHIIGRAMPNRFLTRLYDIEYTINTYMDKDKFYPVRFEKVRRVKGKFTNVVIDFYQKRKEANYKVWGFAPLVTLFGVRDEKENAKPDTVKILEGTQDLFSSLYYFRLLPIKESQSYSLNIYYDRKNWPAAIKVKKPILKDMRKKGSFTVFEIEVESDLVKYILGKRNFSVYFTADSRRIPVEFKLRTAVGLMRGVIQNPSD